jgi:signal transduction histidine kinase
MEVEVRGTGRTLKVSLEKISLPREMEFVQGLIDAVEEYEKTLGVIVYHEGKDLTFRSSSLEDGIEPYLEMIRRSIQEDRILENFAVYAHYPVFSYTFPLKDKRGRCVGGVCILQHTSFMEEDIRKAKWGMFTMIVLLIGGTVALILFVTRRWITHPIAQLTEGIRNLARGDLYSKIDLKRKDELSELAKAFNQMALDLRRAREKMVEEAEAKLELERNLRQSEKLATIGQLTSGLAHEIGTPLNIISGRTELVKKRLKDQEGVQKNLDIILLQTEKITKIIQQLLGFVRKKKPEQRPLNFRALLETTLDFLDHQIQKQKVRVIKEMENPLPPVVGDPDELQQVFLNLIVNAIQAMSDGGTLRVIASSKWMAKEGITDGQKSYVEVCVEDNGIGMEKELMRQIFTPFFTTKKGEKGTGLGLTISQGIIEDHEGWIEVESEMDKGTLFKVYLPVFKEEVKHEGEGL